MYYLYFYCSKYDTSILWFTVLFIPIGVLHITIQSCPRQLYTQTEIN